MTVCLIELRKEARDWIARHGVSGEHTLDSLEAVLAAAFCVERHVQEHLWELGGEGHRIQSLSYARSLHNAQYQAHQAVVTKTGSRLEAKQRQQKAAGDRSALTVCVGKRMRRLPEQVLAKHAPDLLEHYGENIVPLGAGDGCGMIILDSAEPRLPKEYCDRCQSRNGKTMNAGLAKNARKRLRDARRPHKLKR